MDYKIFESMVHPLRMRVLQEVLKRGTATVKDIAEACNDVPPASLYRHINRLAQDNLLEVAAENKVRGTLEKVYRIKNNPFDEINRAIESQNREQLMNLFYQFSMNLLSDFQSYLSKEAIDPEKDGVGFRSYPLYLTDDEFFKMMTDIKQILIRHVDNKPSPERKLRKLSTVVTPIEE